MCVSSCLRCLSSVTKCLWPALLIPLMPKSNHILHILIPPHNYSHIQFLLGSLCKPHDFVLFILFAKLLSSYMTPCGMSWMLHILRLKSGRVWLHCSAAEMGSKWIAAWILSGLSKFSPSLFASSIFSPTHVHPIPTSIQPFTSLPEVKSIVPQWIIWLPLFCNWVELHIDFSLEQEWRWVKLLAVVKKGFLIWPSHLAEDSFLLSCCVLN